MIKRLFDILLGVLLLIVLSPVMVIIALLIRIKLGRPVMFKQQRPGLAGRPFKLIKFRTMTERTDATGNPIPDELRLTKLGMLLRKSSLDELPQLFNVIKGDLSLVGPRPLLVEYLPLYTKEQARRHKVKPGITGWAQVNGRNAINWEERFCLDVWYVDNRNFWLDLKILWFTIIKVLVREGIAEKGNATMSKFTGSQTGIHVSHTDNPDHTREKSNS